MNNKKLSTILGGFLFVMPFLLAGEAQAGIFKCVNTEGQTVYLDKPCPVKDEETEMKAVKDPKNGYIPPAFVNKVESENNSKSTTTDENAPMGKSKKPKKQSEAANTSGNGGKGFERNNSIAKDRNRDSNSAAVNGSASPSEESVSNVIQIDPARTQHY